MSCDLFQNIDSKDMLPCQKRERKKKIELPEIAQNEMPGAHVRCSHYTTAFQNAIDLASIVPRTAAITDDNSDNWILLTHTERLKAKRQNTHSNRKTKNKRNSYGVTIRLRCGLRASTLTRPKMQRHNIVFCACLFLFCIAAHRHPLPAAIRIRQHFFLFVVVTVWAEVR